jgi:hypothetical protein
MKEPLTPKPLGRPRAQGISMNWKSWLFAFLINSAGIFTVFILTFGFKGLLHPDPPIIVIGIAAVISFSVGKIGNEELNRGGHKKLRRILGISLIILIFGLPILLLMKWQHAFWLLCYGFAALAMAPFPLALYLNRSQNKSTSQPTLADAN